MKNFWKKKKILITGCCGTVGSEIIDQLLILDTNLIIGIDNRETELFEKQLKYNNQKKLKLFLSDISIYENCIRDTNNIDIVIHTAAYKHVEICENSPSDAVRNNITGIQNLISASIKNNVKKFIFTSSDKAVNPTNVMGSTKLLAERLVSSANLPKKNSTVFASTRFGNILGSRGSVLKIFEEQIKYKKPLTITDVKMSRYVMTVKKACELVLKGAELAQGGEIFILKMDALNIMDLAKAFFKFKTGNLRDFKFKIIGKKNAEKNYEELITSEELSKLSKKKGMFYVNFENKKNNKLNSMKNFNSKFDKHLSLDQIIEKLKTIQ